MNINLFLFDRFETLDAFGPVTVLGHADYQLTFYSLNGGMITSSQGVSVATLPVTQMNKNDVLLVPGGKGTRELVEDEPFLLVLKDLVHHCSCCLTVCTGSALVAKTGMLDGTVATSNKLAWPWVTSLRAEVKWKHRARWCVDGKFYTSSGVTAGIDMTLDFVAGRQGQEKAREIANRIEYHWNSDSENDPFCVESK